VIMKGGSESEEGSEPPALSLDRPGSAPSGPALSFTPLSISVSMWD